MLSGTEVEDRWRRRALASPLLLIDPRDLRVPRTIGVVSDVLASRAVLDGDKWAAILLAISRYRDRTSFITSQEAWLSMSTEMGAVDTTKLITAVSSCR
jgi:hypothetical protein